jgi:hypothetical protein
MAEARAAAAKSAASAKAPAAAKASGTATKEAGGLQVSDRVLQFHKVDAKKAGLMDIDLGQSSGTAQMFMWIGAIVFLGVVVYAVTLMLG